jgi:STE24 endopeptidase
MFLVVILILSIVLAFPAPLYRWVVGTPAIWVVAVSVTVAPVILAALTARRALGRLDRWPDDPNRGQSALMHGMHAVYGLLGLGQAALLVCTNWPLLVARTPIVGGWLVIPSLLCITPFLLATVLIWVVSYPADRAVRQIALEAYLFRGRPVQPVWSRRQYVLNNVRHQVLFILIPMLLIVLARDVIVLYDDKLRHFSGHEYAADLLLGAAAAAVALIAPEILRHVWSTKRLPDGPLRDRLVQVCRKLSMRYREILVWRAGGVTVNAAVMGVVAPLRYVLITDGMLEQLDDVKIEAVFGHEAGHVKQHHILFFLLFASITGCLVTVFSVHTRHMNPNDPQFQLLATALGIILLIKWGVVFTWISRRFERQADMFGVRVLALSGLPCPQACELHRAGDAHPAPNPLGRALCSTAANVFSNTLNEVAVLNGMAPEARSLRHGSISSRSRTLLRLAADPAAAAAAEKAVARIKAAIIVAAVVCSAWAGWELKLWELLQIHAG